MKANRAERRAVERIVRAIADGEPVDWDAERRATGELPPPIGRLKLVDQVADVHRKLHKDPSQEGSLDVTLTTPPTDVRPLFTWGRLLVYEKIGEGSFAEVYRAFDPVLRIEVALKLRKSTLGQDRRAEEEFLQEARRLARIRHPHIVVVHGVDSHDGRVGLWTDLLRGKTLAQCVDEQGPFSAYEAALIGIDLCGALAALHGSNLVHRDVKPSNVMRVQGGQIVLMDFGSTGERLRTSEAAIVHPVLAGTPLTTAPEVLLHGEAPNPSADIYGLGVLLFWVVSGRYPVEAKSMGELLGKHEHQEMSRLLDVRPDLSPGFSAVVERALKPDPEARYSTVGEMQQALALTVGTSPSVIPPPPKPRRRRVALAVAAIALAVAGLAAGIATGIRGELEVEADLFRSRGGGAERLTSGSAVELGDRLFLEIRGTKRMHVYVLEEDDVGNKFVLFPAATDLQNPLAARARHRLPGRIEEIEQSWVVTSLGNRETVMIIASRQPLDELEAAIVSMKRTSPERESYGPKSPELQDQERGFGEMSPDPSLGEEDSSSTLDGVANLLAMLTSDRSGVWFRKIELKTPGL